jgi:hypothetical protein
MKRAGIALSLVSWIGVAACGGKVFVDPEGAGQGGGGGGFGGGLVGSTSMASTTSATSTTTTTTSTTTSSSGVGGGPPDETLVQVPLGNIPLGTGFSFDVPPTAIGFTLVANVPGDPTSPLAIGVDKLLAPDGVSIVEGYSLGPQNQLFFYANNGIIAAAVPQSDDAEAMPVQSGTWQARIGDFGAGGPTSADVSLWLRQTADGLFHGGALDVNVFLVNGVATQGQITSLLTQAYTNYAGLELGAVQFFDLPDSFAVIDESNFQQAFHQTSVASNKPALNVLYVAAFAGDFQGAGGVSSGLPGVPVMHGTNESGVVAMFFADAIDTIVLRHEGGHFGGLFHTSEFEPGMGDFLADTPLCPNAEVILGNCPDAGNVMFPAAGFGLALSPMQQRVLQGSALYRGVFQAGDSPSPPPADEVGWLGGPRAARPVAAAPVNRAWASGLPRGAAAALTGHVCARGPGGAPQATAASFAALSGVGDAALLGVARDRGAPNYARARAIAALGARGTSGSAVWKALSDLAASDSEPAPVRVSAIQAIASGPGASRAGLLSRLGSGTTPLITKVAKQLLSR